MKKLLEKIKAKIRGFFAGIKKKAIELCIKALKGLSKLVYKYVCAKLDKLAEYLIKKIEE